MQVNIDLYEIVNPLLDWDLQKQKSLGLNFWKAIDIDTNREATGDTKKAAIFNLFHPRA